MRTAMRVAQAALPGSGVLLLVLGAIIWTGNGDQLIGMHVLLGLVLVLSLWTITAISARSGVPRHGGAGRGLGRAGHRHGPGSGGTGARELALDDPGSARGDQHGRHLVGPAPGGNSSGDRNLRVQLRPRRVRPSSAHR